jgi:hypothetical protein
MTPGALGLLVALALAIAGVAGTADAVAKGEVFFDPGSPAGKEYALPVPKARSDASGGGRSSSAESNPPLFGVGVSPGGGPGGGPSGGPDGGSDGSPSLRGKSSQAAALSPGGGGFMNGTALAIAAAVLVLGAGLGVAARRIQRPAG